MSPVKPKPSLRLITLLWFVRSTPRDQNNKPVAEVIETKELGFIHIHLN
jgi:hypothetical protein